MLYGYYNQSIYSTHAIISHWSRCRKGPKREIMEMSLEVRPDPLSPGLLISYANVRTYSDIPTIIVRVCVGTFSTDRSFHRFVTTTTVSCNSTWHFFAIKRTLAHFSLFILIRRLTWPYLPVPERDANFIKTKQNPTKRLHFTL